MNQTDHTQVVPAVASDGFATLRLNRRERFVNSKLHSVPGAVNEIDSGAALFAHLGQGKRASTVIKLG